MKIWNFIYGLPRTNLSHFELGGVRPRRRFQFFWEKIVLLACVTGAISNTYAAENEQDSAEPDMEFLEFLGQFETDAGEWIDPDSLLAEEFTDLLDATTEADAASDSSNNDNATNDTQ